MGEMTVKIDGREYTMAEAERLYNALNALFGRDCVQGAVLSDARHIVRHPYVVTSIDEVYV